MCLWCGIAEHVVDVVAAIDPGVALNDPSVAYNGSASTTAAVSATTNQDIDGLLRGTRWASLVQTFSFPTLATQYGAYSHQVTVNGVLTTVDETTTFQPLNPTMQACARAAFNMVNGFTLLSLTEDTNTPDAATIRLGRSDRAQPTAFAYYPSTSDQGGDVWFGTQTSSSVNTNPLSGNYGWLTHLHEIGHALGLKHAQDLGGVSNVAVTPGHDAMEYTVMTYRSYVNDPLVGGYSNEQWGYAQTYMMYDIAALQYMYGADFGTNASDTSYTFSTLTGELFINGVGQGAPGGNRIFRTLWDGGGVDTYDFANFTGDQSIDLTPGGYSLMSTAQRANLGDGQFAHGNLYNALQFQGDSRSLIENATGGSGNDTITGNAANNVLSGNAGNDTLDGGAGVDKLLGGAGNDTIFYDAADDLANVLGGADTDTLVFTSGAAPITFDLVAHQFELAEGRITDTGANPWASYVDHYDSAWRKDYEAGIMDDGRTYYEDYDQLGTQTWSRITYFNDALGRSDVESGQLRSGASYSSDLDNGNLYSWTRLDYWSDSLGRADTESGQLDDGRHYNSDIDNGNLYSWTRIDYWSDSQGRPDVETGFLDDLRSYNSDIDNGNLYSWRRIDNWADSLGRLDYQNGVYDATDATHPGWTWQIDYDQADQFAWARVERFYNAAGVIQSETYF
jgi:Ca2+-binding RTX toxin-like protein